MSVFSEIRERIHSNHKEYLFIRKGNFNVCTVRIKNYTLDLAPEVDIQFSMIVHLYPSEVQEIADFARTLEDEVRL